jgi:protein-S-isoprenylcysteine O-methyltransferase Ste14
MRIKAAWRRKLQLYLSGVIIYSLGILILKYLPYFQNSLRTETHNIIFNIYLTYLIIAPFFYLIFANRYSENKPYLFLRGIFNIILRRQKSFQQDEKIAALFILVKIFFLPVMFNFTYGNIEHLINLSKSGRFIWYPFIFTLMFAIDTAIFSFGYTFEFKKLKNVVKSVEPTFFGWFVTLICYPPFNWMTGNYIPWGANDYVSFWSPTITTIFRIVLIILLVIYTWATVSLGFKASNLTNRGIVCKFPYSVVRHPAYISKCLIWWITLIPVISWPFALGMFFWTVIYFFRASTEERHLGMDPEYQEYKKKVKYKFIPFIW